MFMPTLSVLVKCNSLFIDLALLIDKLIVFKFKVVIFLGIGLGGEYINYRCSHRSTRGGPFTAFSYIYLPLIIVWQQKCNYAIKKKYRTYSIHSI